MDSSKDRKLVITSIIVGILVVGLWSLTLVFFKGVGETARGTFGDMFGAVNALFSGLAFAGIIFTILLQREELSLQRLELQETRNELKRSADSQERSEKAAINQQNQTTFFNLLEHQKKLLETLKLNDKIGFEGVREFATETRKNLINFVKMESDGKFPRYTDTLNHPYNSIQNNKSGIKTYLKNLETIVEFIETSLSNKELFHSILYNYMSVPEKYILGTFYYYGKEHQTKFLKKYFNYIEYYETDLEKYKNDSDKYFPTISISPKGYKNMYQENLETLNPILEIFIKIQRNYFDKDLKLVGIDFGIKNQSNEKIKLNESIFSITEITNSAEQINADITEVIKLKAPLLKNGHYYFEYLFYLTYDNRNYSVSYQHGIYKTTEMRHDGEGDYYDETRYVLMDFD